MKFEHLVEINDLLNPLIDVLSREQLWRGLVLRASSPKLFVPYLDQAEILEHSASHLKRRLHYGQLIVEDVVELDTLQQLFYRVPAQGEIPASTLLMRIEEPQPQHLFVRFIYDDGASTDADEANQMYDDFRKSAYQEADTDTIRQIRELAEAGRLDSLLN